MRGLIQLSFLFVVVGGIQVQKSVIRYLGTDYLMRDGCPEPECDLAQRECIRTRNMVRALYSHCIQSEDGEHVGCVTDRLADGALITLPVYGTMCAAMCYEIDPNTLAKVHRCPHQGFRQHNPALGHLFRKK